MSDEIQQVENAGQEFIGVYADTLSFLNRFMQEMREFAGSSPPKKFKSPKLPKSKSSDSNLSDMLEDNLTSFKFTGQDTDLCYFAQCDRMPITAVANISDAQIKKSVIENFDRFLKNDFLEIKDDSIYITPKGKKYIQNDFFIQQAKADQMQMHNKLLLKSAEKENVEVIALTGNYVNDFTYFCHSDKLDLIDVISHPDKKLSSQILENVKLWQKKEAVTVENGIATITPNGKEMLNMPEFQQVSRHLTPKALADVNIQSSQFLVKLQTAAKTQVQQNVLKNTVTKAIKR